MRRPAPSVLTLALAAVLGLGALPCGATPQEGKAQHPAPSQRSPENMAPSQRSPEGTTPHRRGPEGTAHLPAPRVQQPMKPDVESRRTPRSLDENSRRSTPQPVRDTRTSTDVRRYADSHVVIPRHWQRLEHLPNLNYWHSRDLLAELQWMSRSGFIPVTPLSDGVDSLNDYAQQLAGWRAYGIAVPAGGTLQVEVQHAKLGWFRLMLVDKWGKPGPGMLHATIAHQPIMVTYKNPGKEATAVYVIVDDPAWWSSPGDPYTLQVRRDWEPAKTDLSQVKMVAGLWGATPSVSAQFRRPSLTGPAVYPR